MRIRNLDSATAHMRAVTRTFRSFRCCSLLEYRFQSSCDLKSRVMAAGIVTSRDVLSPPACTGVEIIVVGKIANHDAAQSCHDDKSVMN